VLLERAAAASEEKVLKQSRFGVAAVTHRAASQ